MNSTIPNNIFKKRFERILQESMTAGEGGAFGNTDAIFDPDNAMYRSGDYYASGDARIPKVLGDVQTRNGKIRRKRKNTKNKIK